MHWIELLAVASTWLCNQVDTQYQVIHDLLSRMDDTTASRDELKRVVSDYWEENRNHCHANLRSRVVEQDGGT